jgi:hypothetical protein
MNSVKENILDLLIAILDSMNLFKITVFLFTDFNILFSRVLIKNVKYPCFLIYNVCQQGAQPQPNKICTKEEL